MLSPIAFQRNGATVTPSLTTTATSGAVSLQVGGYQLCEIVNTSTTISVAFSFTASGASTAAATAADRVIGPSSTLYEQLPLGATSASAIPLASGSPAVYFTPGTARV